MRRIIIGMSETSGLLYGIRLIEVLADIEAKAAAGERFIAAPCSTMATRCLSFGAGIYAVPLSALWE